jgi:hypothetical protein
MVERRQRAPRYRYRVGFSPSVDDPHEIGPVGALGPHALVADDEGIAVEKWYDCVGKAVIGRVVVPARHHTGPRHVGNVEDDQAPVDLAGRVAARRR